MFILGATLTSDPSSAAQVIPGRKGRATDGLCWVGERLFSAGLNGEITEYDLDSLRPKYSTSAYGGPIWAISSNPQGTVLAVSGDPAGFFGPRPRPGPGPPFLPVLTSVLMFPVSGWLRGRDSEDV